MRSVRLFSSSCRRNLKKSPLYTRTGDAGTSSLFSGERRPKTDSVFEALGHLDELNAALGIAREHCRSVQPIADQVPIIQSRLMDIASHVATPPPPPERENAVSAARSARTALSEDLVDQLEKWIDEIDSELLPLRNFILPGGTVGSAHLHMARAMSRRAERAVWTVNDEAIAMRSSDNETPDAVSDVALRYCNRLSDYLFAAARFACAAEDGEETIYQK